MAIPTLPTWSLKLNAKDVSTTYGLLVRDVEGIDIAPPVDVRVSRLPGLARPAISEPVPKGRRIRVRGTIIGTTALDLAQKMALLAQEIGFTSYGSRVVNLQINVPNFAFDCVYAGEWTPEYIGARMIATHAKLTFSLIVLENETETAIESLASGTLDATDMTPVYISATAGKGGAWTPASTFDQSQIKIANANATSISTVEIKALFQKAMRRISGTMSGSLKLSDGIYPASKSVRWETGDTHTLKYPTTDGEFTPKSEQFQIVLAYRPQYVAGVDSVEKYLFDCNNGTAGNRTSIYYHGVDKNMYFSVGGTTVKTAGNFLLQNTWASIVCKYDGAGSMSISVAGGAVTGSATTSTSGVTPADPNGNFYIGSRADASLPCIGDIGEVLIIGTPGVDTGAISFTYGLGRRPSIEDNTNKVTEWLSFGTDFRSQLGVDGIGRGVRKLVATETNLVAQNEELWIDLARRRAWAWNTATGSRLEVTSEFDLSPEWPTLGQFGTLLINNTPKQASVTYDILGRPTVIQ